jgi:hypothetical protein
MQVIFTWMSASISLLASNTLWGDRLRWTIGGEHPWQYLIAETI